MSKQHWKPGNMLYPVPTVMVTCQRRTERPNIITIAWAGTICTNPAMVSISVRKERYSYGILRDTGEFVINLTTEQIVQAADYCGVRSGRDVDKFAETGLTPCKSKVVNCPGILESPINMECKVVDVMNLGSHDMFLARVESVSVDEMLLDDTGSLRLDKSGLVVYSHGNYFELGKQLGSFGYSVKKKRTSNSKKSRNKKSKNCFCK